MRYKIRPRPPRRRHRVGAAGALGAGALILALGGAFMLDAVGDRSELDVVVEYARAHAQDPVDLATRAARANRIVLLGDVPTLPGPKRLAADIIERVATDHGLDAVVLEIPSRYQEAVDHYLDSDPENVSLLLSAEGLVRETGGSTQPHLDIFRTIWALNEELGPARRIRILAADLETWPPGPGTSPRRAVELFARRDARIVQVVEEQVLAREPAARIILFVNGIHVLKTLQPRIQVGGGSPATPETVAALLQETHPSEVYSILVDGAPGATAYDQVVAFTSTDLYDLFRRRLPGESFALPLSDDILNLTATPLRGSASPGVELQFGVADVRLTDVADAYVFLGSAWGG